jgi:hypothetical protein
MNYIKLYYIEKYIFEDVRYSFEKNRKLNAFDFFCIIIWKANRAKSKIANTLIKNYKKPHAKLNLIVKKLTSSVAQAPDDKTRMRILIEEWGLLLPMASAVLTVLYPDNFTVYDVRVCGELGEYHELKNVKKFDRLWESYEKYMSKVREYEPAIKTLRDKDRALWAKSFEKQLKHDINKCFRK